MQTTPEEFGRHFAALSDEALLDLNRGDLTAVARQVLDLELARRGLVLESPAAETGLAAGSDDPVEWVTVGTFLWPAEAQCATQLLRSAGMLVYLANEHTLNVN